LEFQPNNFQLRSIMGGSNLNSEGYLIREFGRGIAEIVEGKPSLCQAPTLGWRRIITGCRRLVLGCSGVCCWKNRNPRLCGLFGSVPPGPPVRDGQRGIKRRVGESPPRRPLRAVTLAVSLRANGRAQGDCQHGGNGTATERRRKGASLIGRRLLVMGTAFLSLALVSGLRGLDGRRCARGCGSATRGGWRRCWPSPRRRRCGRRPCRGCASCRGASGRPRS